MQNVHTLMGARGWPWRVERRERAGRRAEFVYLSRPHADGAVTLVAVRPHEPTASIEAHERVTALPVRLALAAARTAFRAEQHALALHAAERLRGDIHHWQLAPAIALARGHARVLVADD